MPAWLRSRRLGLAIAGVATVIAIGGGCAQGSQPGDPWASAATPLPSTSPNTLATQSDPRDLPRTDQGAADFVTAWFTALNAGYVAGRVDTTTDLSGPDCTACADYHADLASLAVDGARTDVAPFQIEDVRADGADTGVAVVTLSYQVVEVRVRRPDGTQEAHPGERAMPIRAAVVWTDSGWLMGEVGQ